MLDSLPLLPSPSTSVGVLPKSAGPTTKAILHTTFTISGLEPCDDYVTVSPCTVQADLYPDFPHFEKLTASCKYTTNNLNFICNWQFHLYMYIYMYVIAIKNIHTYIHYIHYQCNTILYNSFGIASAGARTCMLDTCIHRLVILFSSV